MTYRDPYKETVDFLKKENQKLEGPKEGPLSLIGAVIVDAFTWLWLTPTIFVSFWGWFLVPLGVSVIGHWHALGLMTMFYMVSHRLIQMDNVKADKMTHFQKSMAIVIGQLFAWLIGYLCS